MRLIDTPIPVPDEIAELAVDARLVRPAGNSQILLPDDSRSTLEYLDGNHVQNFHKQYFEAVAPLQQAIGFLAGGWWEIIVSDALDRSGIVRDLRWSVEIGDRDGASLEEDVVALDGANLVYVSCKRGGAKARLLPQLEEIKSRSTRIGGIFNRRFLAVLNAPRGKVMANLEKRAQELGIHILTRESVYETDFSQ